MKGFLGRGISKDRDFVVGRKELGGGGVVNEEERERRWGLRRGLGLD